MRCMRTSVWWFVSLCVCSYLRLFVCVCLCVVVGSLYSFDRVFVSSLNPLLACLVACAFD